MQILPKAFPNTLQHKEVLYRCLETLTLLLVLHVLIQIIYDFQVHKISLAKLFAVTQTNLITSRLMMSVLLNVTHCHPAHGFRSVKQTVPTP
jgi:hypothetical protein